MKNIFNSKVFKVFLLIMMFVDNVYAGLNEDLIEAAGSGDIKLVKSLIGQGADVNTINEKKKTPLIEAAKRGHIDVVQILIDAKADIDYESENSFTVIMYAASGGNKELVEVLLNNGVDINYQSDRGEGYTALMTAASVGQFEMVKFLIDNDADIQIMTAENWGVLTAAVGSGRNEIVNLLFDNGADIKETDSFGLTLLMVAVDGVYLSTCKMLLENGAEVNAVDVDGLTALMYSVRQKNKETDFIDVLLEHDAELDIEDNNKRTALMHAVLEENYAAVRILLKHKAEITVKDADGRTALIHAVTNGNMDIIDLLLKNGAETDIVSNTGWTPLMFASYYGNYEVVDLLLNKGVDVSVINSKGRTALTLAVEKGKLDIVKLLLKKGLDINNKDTEGLTPLMLAAHFGHYEVAEFLLNNGVDMYAKDNLDWTPIIFAAANGHVNIAKLLVEKGVNIDGEYQDSKTVLMWAADNGYLNIVDFLINAGADVNATGVGGWTAMMDAIFRGNYEVVELLLNNGADFSAGEDAIGQTPLMLASVYGHVNIAKLLINAGTDINARDKYGWTSMMRAAGEGRLNIVKLLVEKGADINIKATGKIDNGIGRNALMIAAAKGRTGVVRFFKDYGVDVNERSGKGENLLMIAVDGGRINVVTQLIEYGVNVNSVVRTQTALDIAESNNYIAIKNILVDAGALNYQELSSSDENIQIVQESVKIKKAAKDLTGYSSEEKEKYYKDLSLEIKLLPEDNVNNRDDEARTLLMNMSSIGCLECINILLEKGANINIIGPEGRTALMTAVVHGNLDITELLIKKGAKINVQNRYSHTALMMSASAGKTAVVELLIESNADLEISNGIRQTALHFAADSGHIETAKILISAGADLNALDEFYDTALTLAAEKVYTYLVKVLLDSGASYDFDIKAAREPVALYQTLINKDKKNILHATKILGELGEGETLYKFYAKTSKIDIFTQVRKNSLFDKSINLLTGSKDELLKSSGIYMEALKAREEGRYQDQVKLAKEVLNIISEDKNPGLAVLVRWLQAQGELKLGKLKEAQMTVESADKLIHKLTINDKKSHEEFFLSFNQYMKGEVYRVKGDNYYAIAAYEKALKMLEVERNDLFEMDGEATRLEVMIQTGLGIIEVHEGKIEEGRKNLRMAVEKARDLTSRHSVEMQSEEDRYVALASLAISLNDGEKALEFLEELAVRNANYASRKVRYTLADPEKQALIDKFNLIRNEIRDLNRKIAEKISQAGSVKKAESLEEFSDMMSNLNEKRRLFKAFKTNLKKNHRDLAVLLDSEPVNIKDVQKYLPKDIALLKYLILPEKIFIFVIRRDSIDIAESYVKQEHLETMVSEYRDFITDMVVGKERKRVIASLSADLGKSLVLPVKESGFLKNIKTLGIIPTGVLYYLPFGTISADIEDSGKLLLDLFDIFYVNSISMLSIAMGRESGKIDSNASLTAFSNPDGTLKFANIETAKISKHFSESMIFANEKATKDKILNIDGDGYFLHLSTHGRLDASDSTKSNIIFSDGNLTVEEIWGIPLNGVRLVTLSACETGVGEVLSGDDVVSLDSAFVYAGSPAVVSTLWEVEDQATSELMQIFYENLKDGKTKSASLSQAQRNIKDIYQHPYYWSAFTMRGDWR